MGLFKAKPKLGGGGKEMHPSSGGAPFARSVGQSGPKVYLRFGVSAALVRFANHLLWIVCIVNETGLD